MTTDHKNEKAALRKVVRQALREADSVDMVRWSDQITGRLVALTEYRQAQAVMVYLSFRTEYQTAALIEHALGAGKAVCAPKVNWRTGRMAPVVLRGSDDYELDDHRIKEPRSDERFPLAEVGMVVVPGLAFDGRGRRLGRGGGFYDKLLSRTDVQAIKLAAAFDLQIVSRVPVDPHDQPVDAILTPSKLMRFVRRPASILHSDEGFTRENEKDTFLGMDF